MRTSLGIWAFGPMVTRFVPGGYQGNWANEPMPEKVHRAVSGLGYLMDDYEFHYPGELTRDNLDDVRAALDGHGIYAIAGGLHVDARFQKGGLTNLDDSVRSEALRFLVPLLVMAVGFSLLFVTLHLAAMRNEILRRRVRSLQMMQASKPAA